MSTTSSADAVTSPSPHSIRLLLRAQHRALADLPIEQSTSSGSSNWVFRLGEDLAVRLPRSDDYVAPLLNEIEWLPRLGPSLPASVPEVVYAGQPSNAFPRPWAVVTWLAGRNPEALPASAQARLAESLGAFLQALHNIEVAGVPGGPERWGYRCGEPVTETMDRWAEAAAVKLSDLYAPDRIQEAWRRLRDVPGPDGPRCWVHTDLSEENLLVDTDGRLAGVIDFGDLGVGDSSIDLLYAWSMFDAPARETLRQSAGASDATWLRARAWAFVGPGLLTLANYRDTMPKRASRLASMVEAVAADVGVALR